MLVKKDSHLQDVSLGTLGVGTQGKLGQTESS
jgi:hypothetical protein